MPTDLPAPTNRLDEEGFPIAIGFQPVPGEAIEVDSHRQDDDGLEETQALDSAAPTEQQGPLTGYELVADMMRRQDAVLSQLDDLNARIESAIKEVSAARKSEIEAIEAEPEFDSVSPAGQPTDLRKAA